MSRTIGLPVVDDQLGHHTYILYWLVDMLVKSLRILLSFPQLLYVHLGILFVVKAVASTSASSSASVLPQNLRIVSEDCFISYGDFCYLYTRDTDK